ncbi:hemerythrin domain-containing protein [Ensifer soli]|uniref:hemerythrin domain-containing protein n=1 Tax=Ciceribacter sp. sgz301302 TaxID=3342379 RepID=UPI0035B89CA0
MAVDERRMEAWPHGCEIGCLSPEDLAGMDIGEAMALIHARKVSLCGELENIADSLPGGIDALDCLVAASRLLPLLRRAHAFEEARIFPAYDALTAGGGPASTARLRAEHIEDECFAADLTEILLSVGHGGRVENAETFGFMLRGFFEGLRRHIAFENEHVVPIIRDAAISRRSAV